MHNKKHKHITQNGNALLYVLISIALFAALGFTIARQMNANSTQELDDAKVEFYTTQIMTHAVQVQSAIEQMMITGSAITDLDFTLPSDGGFNTAPHIHKVYHPQGGGINIPTIPDGILNELSSPPAAGWHMGLFASIEWTASTASDVILTAHQITQPVCAAINEKITGSDAIPALTSGDLDDYFVDTATNTELTNTICASCEGFSALCVSNTAGTAYSYYNIIAPR